MNLSERIRIAALCPMKWSEMEGDERIRRCGACKLNVYNAASLTTEEIEQLLCGSDRTCMRIYRRTDGTLVTGDCSRLWAERRKAAVSLLSEGMTILGGLLTLFVIAVITITLFGDNIRRLFQGPEMGALAGAIPPPPHVMKKGLVKPHASPGGY